MLAEENVLITFLGAFVQILSVFVRGFRDLYRREDRLEQLFAIGVVTGHCHLRLLGVVLSLLHVARLFQRAHVLALAVGVGVLRRAAGKHFTRLRRLQLHLAPWSFELAQRSLLVEQAQIGKRLKLLVASHGGVGLRRGRGPVQHIGVRVDRPGVYLRLKTTKVKLNLAVLQAQRFLLQSRVLPRHEARGDDQHGRWLLG